MSQGVCTLSPDTNPQCSGRNIPARSHVVLQAGPCSGHCLSALSDQWWFIAQQMTAYPANRLPFLHFHCSWETNSQWRKMCWLVLLTSVALIVNFWHVTWGKNLTICSVNKHTNQISRERLFQKPIKLQERAKQNLTKHPYTGFCLSPEHISCFFSAADWGGTFNYCHLQVCSRN